MKGVLKDGGQAEKGDRAGGGHSFQAEDRNSHASTGEHMTYSGSAGDTLTLTQVQGVMESSEFLQVILPLRLANRSQFTYITT